jgi:hypothetical protein
MSEESFPEPTRPDEPPQAGDDLVFPGTGVHIIRDRAVPPGQTPELSWTGSHKYVAHLSSLANIRACDTPKRGANSPTAVVPEQEVAAWQTLLAVADPRVIDGAVGGHYPGRGLKKTFSQQAEERGSGREQALLIQDRVPYLRELEGLIDGRLADTRTGVIPVPEVEAWATLLEPVGEMTEDQHGYDVLHRVTAAIAAQAEKH